MSDKSENFKSDLIQLLITAIIVGFLFLTVKVLSNIEVKYAKPYVSKTLEERLKMLPPSAKVLSEEAKLIFPEYANQPELFYFSWSKENKIKFIMKIPIDTLSENEIIETYFKRYEKYQWEQETDENIFIFKSKTSDLKSCIYKDFFQDPNFWKIIFTNTKTSCY